MTNYESYSKCLHGPILSVHCGGKIKRGETEAATFEEALQQLLSLGLREAGLAVNDENQWQERVVEAIPFLWAKRHLNPEEALFLLTGTIANHAVYRFEWDGEDLFTMRPDFGRLCILTNFSEPPINSYEKSIRENLLCYRAEVAAIYFAVKHNEIEGLEVFGKDMEAPIESWIGLFQKRNFNLSHIPAEYLIDKYSRLQTEIDSLRQVLLKTKAQVVEFQNSRSSAYPRELEAAISVFDEFWKDRPLNMNTAPVAVVEAFISDLMGGNVDRTALKRIATIAKPEHERVGGAPSSERPTFKGHSAEKKITPQ